MIRNVVLAIGRFFAFFFALVLTAAVVTTCYATVGGQSFGNTWDAVKALIVSAIVLLILTIGTAAIDDYLDQQARAHTSMTPAAGDPVA